MRTDDFYYELPKELIAQAPSSERDKARLMVVERQGTGIEHSCFAALPNYLRPGIYWCSMIPGPPARLLGRRKQTGGRVEILLLSRWGRPGGGSS